MSELYHHGVLGQKWGVRRYQFKDGSLTMEGRRHYGYTGHGSKVKNQDGSLTDYGRKYFGYDDVKRGEYKAKKDDYTIKAGTKIKRLANPYSNGYDVNVFSAYRLDDIDEYTGVLGRMSATNQLKNFGNVSLQQVTMESDRDLHIPSKATAKQEFKEYAKENKDKLLKIFDEYVDANPTKRGKMYKRMTEKDLELDDPRKLEYAYRRFNAVMGMGTSSNNFDVIKGYQNRLIKKGYDGIPDENDINVSTFKAKAPTILFDTKDSITKTSTRDLSPSEVLAAYDRSIVSKTIRSFSKADRKYNAGNENVIKKKQHERYAEKDKTLLNKNYTLNNLAEDMGVNRYRSSEIKKINKYMDSGMTYEEAKNKYNSNHSTWDNNIVDKVMRKYGI